MQSEEKNWEILESVNWEQECKTVNSATLKIRLMKRYSQEEILEAGKFQSKMSNVLYQKINEYENDNETLGNYGGDDSFGDLLDHIVGCGQGRYNEIMEDPKLAGSVDYVENFAYVIPYFTADWYNLVPEYWIAKAEGCELDLMDYEDPSEEVVELLERFRHVTKKDFVQATAGFQSDSLKGYNTELYDRYYQFEGNEHMAKFSNILTDILRWQVEA